MVIIIDANILISAIINPEGKISKIIVLSENVEFILPNYAAIELEKHKNKICSTYSMPPILFDKIFLKLSAYFLIFSEREIETVYFEKALGLVASIDEKDATYVAFALTFDALLWTGDLKLYRGLRRKNFKQIITTKELEQIINGL